MSDLLLAAAEIGKPFVPGGAMLRPFAAELILIATIIGVLLAPFFTPRRSNLIAAAVAMAGVLIALLTLVFTRPGDGGFQLRGMLVSDNFAVLWKIMLLLFTAGVIL